MYLIVFVFPDSVVRESNAFGQSLEPNSGPTPVHFSSVFCFGTEDQLLDCNHALGNVDGCSHSQDVGVTCTSNEVQLPGNSASIIDKATSVNVTFPQN